MQITNQSTWSAGNLRLRVGYFAELDTAEVPIDEIAGHFPLELLVAPVAQVLEHEQPQHDLGRRAASTATRALRPATPHYSNYFVDDLVVIEQLIDPSELRIHHLARTRQLRAEEHHVIERQLTAAASRRHPAT
jgi:hypothetical protein